jgi:hypothetical protein
MDIYSILSKRLGFRFTYDIIYTVNLRVLSFSYFKGLSCRLDIVP